MTDWQKLLREDDDELGLAANVPLWRATPAGPLPAAKAQAVPNAEAPPLLQAIQPQPTINAEVTAPAQSPLLQAITAGTAPAGTAPKLGKRHVSAGVAGPAYAAPRHASYVPGAQPRKRMG